MTVSICIQQQPYAYMQCFEYVFPKLSHSQLVLNLFFLVFRREKELAISRVLDPVLRARVHSVEISLRIGKKQKKTLIR
jgi:choline-glycine betaine transporter